MRGLIELNETWAVRIVICTNHETVLDGRELDCAGATEDEIVSDATTEASNVILDAFDSYADSDSFFANWHGGKYYGQRVAYRVGHIVADVYTRAVDEVFNEGTDEEEKTYTDWKWTEDRLPAELDARVRKAMDAADKAHTDALDKWEACSKAQSARFAREEADESAVE